MKKICFRYMLLGAITALICAIPTQADTDDTATFSLQDGDKISQLQKERDDAKAMLVLHGIKPYRYWVILRANLLYENFVSYDDAVFMNAKLTINLNQVVSPYIGVGIGGGFFGIYAGTNIGVEKSFVYNHGISITPSVGTHLGVYGMSSGYPVYGVYALCEMAFSHKRFAPYINTGVRYSGFSWHNVHTISFPLGVGLSLKI